MAKENGITLIGRLIEPNGLELGTLTIIEGGEGDRRVNCDALGHQLESGD